MNNYKCDKSETCKEREICEHAKNHIHGKLEHNALILCSDAHVCIKGKYICKCKKVER